MGMVLVELPTIRQVQRIYDVLVEELGAAWDLDRGVAFYDRGGQRRVLRIVRGVKKGKTVYRIRLDCAKF